MSPRSGADFGTFGERVEFKPVKFKPINAEFTKAPPSSIYRVSRDSVWARWRRGYELASSTSYTNDFAFPFTYTVPIDPGTPGYAAISNKFDGAFHGFPTYNKEFGMHWAGVRAGGTLRFDQIKDHTGALAYIKTVTSDANYVYVTLNGDWSSTNPLPSPLYSVVPGSTEGLKIVNGEVLEDRIITANGNIIDADTINPSTQKRYGYTQFVLLDVFPFDGILKLQRVGSVEVTFDKRRTTPAISTPALNRFFTTGARYSCSCQDFTQRNYAFMTNLDNRKNVYFPVTRPNALKPGRYEVITQDGVVNNNSTTRADVNRNMTVISPDAAYLLPTTIAENSEVKVKSTRDNPGVYADFGYIYNRNVKAPGIAGATPEGIPDYLDYAATDTEVKVISDYWSPLLDEKRYCKHAFALRFIMGDNPPEPQDFPVEPESLAVWEQTLVRDMEKQDRGAMYQQMKQSIGYMDMPPFNCQSPVVLPMVRSLLNVPSNYVTISGFMMYDKHGSSYYPASGETPAIL
jgi:hypothetical protein